MKKNKLKKIFLIILCTWLNVFCLNMQSAYAQSVTGHVDYNSFNQGVKTGADLKNKVNSRNEGRSVLDGCKPWSEKYADIQACILCPVFDVILKTDQSMATMSFKSLAGSFRNVIIVVLALFIAYHTLLTVSAVTKQDVAKYLQTISIQAFKVLVAVLLLTNSNYIYNYAINPLMKAGLEFGLTIIDSKVAADLKSNTDIAAMPKGVISQDLLGQVLATINLFSKSSAELPAIGSSLICVSTHTASWHGIIPDVSMFIEGLVAYAFGWCITLACCFYLLDSVVRFGIFCTLLPFLIACWPFKITMKYTKAGWDIFMNTFFNFVMMGLVISLSSELSVQALTGGSGGKDELETLLQGAGSNDIQALKEAMSLDGTKFLVLIACCIFAFKLVAQIGELANAVSSTSGPKNNIGAKLGGLAAQAATRVAMGGKGADGKRSGGVVGAAAKITGISAAAGSIKDRINAHSDSIRQKIAGGAPAGSGGSSKNTSNNTTSAGGNNAGDNGSGAPDSGSDGENDEHTSAGDGWSDDTSTWD